MYMTIESNQSVMMTTEVLYNWTNKTTEVKMTTEVITHTLETTEVKMTTNVIHTHTLRPPRSDDLAMSHNMNT